jgi:uncharacterized protein (TIGR02757 family)
MKNHQTIKNLKTFLDVKAELYNRPDFIADDPISIPHRFSKKEDIEISGFLAATIAWGQRKTIVKNANRLVDWMDLSPHDFILNFTENNLSPFRKFAHRTFNGIDCEYFLWSLKNIYQNHAGLENAFCGGFDNTDDDVKAAIINFRKIFFEMKHPARTGKHVADPARKSAAKRINMFLRWMVRRDTNGVDFGIWAKIDPSQLICPLDVHSGNIARKLGLLHRKNNDWQAAIELTNFLRKLDPADPVKYDFALFGVGVFEKKEPLFDKKA